MGHFRFRQSVRLFPGVRLNASKSGLSVSLGTRGAWYTIGPRGSRTTVSLPGRSVVDGVYAQGNTVAPTA